MRGKGRVTIQFGCCYNYAPVSILQSYLSSLLLHTELSALNYVLLLGDNSVTKTPPLPPKPNPQQLTTFLYDRDVAYGLITDGIMTKLSLWQDKNGNPPGILKSETVDPLPDLLKVMIRRLIRWHVMPSTCVPDSCIINIYEEGDCIPPHIDNHDFVRPFCTVSFLSECNIVFGSNLKIVGPGEFAGAIAIPLPVG